MPRYDTVCQPCKALWDDVTCTLRTRTRLGGIPCPHCGAPCKVSWHNQQAPGVLATSTPFRVPGLKGEFTSYREVEKLALAQGQRILEGDEKKAIQQSNKEASAEYAEELGFSCKEAFVEARKNNGTEMVDNARQKYVEQQRRRHGAGYNLGAKDDKWGSSGLRQTAS